MVTNNSSLENIPIASDSAVRHDTLWFDDGSIVLMAEQTLFRVHRSILCVHSEIFADMFRIPQPKDQTTIEGCAVICFSDKAADFVGLLKAMYDPLYFDTIQSDFGTDVATMLAPVSGILRLSTKYSILRLRQKCIDILQTKFPTRLGYVSLVLDKSKNLSADIRFSIVNLARETNVPIFLPFAFYLCACLPPKLILQGTSTAELSWKDKAICLAGRAELLHIQRTLSYSPFLVIKSSPSCGKRPLSCASRIPGTIRMDWEWRSYVEILALESVSRMNMEKHACGPCVDHAISQYRDGCQQVWNVLPEIFQLGSWEDTLSVQNS